LLLLLLLVVCVCVGTMSLEGFLKKQGVKGPRKTFKKRWFVLKDDNKIYYYEKKNDAVEKGYIDVSEGMRQLVLTPTTRVVVVIGISTIATRQHSQSYTSSMLVGT
jgi:hypothetical protein